MRAPWSPQARAVRQQRKLRREHVQNTPHMSVRVTIERRQGRLVMSSISGVGVDVTAALWNAHGRAANILKEIGEHLAQLEETEPAP